MLVSICKLYGNWLDEFIVSDVCLSHRVMTHTVTLSLSSYITMLCVTSQYAVTSPCCVLPHSLQLHSERSDSNVLHFVLLISELCPLCSCPVRTLHSNCVFWDVKQCWHFMDVCGPMSGVELPSVGRFPPEGGKSALRQAEGPTPPSLQLTTDLHLVLRPSWCGQG
jgi:hypothetical protein